MGLDAAGAAIASPRHNRIAAPLASACRNRPSTPLASASRNRVSTPHRHATALKAMPSRLAASVTAFGDIAVFAQRPDREKRRHRHRRELEQDQDSLVCVYVGSA